MKRICSVVALIGGLIGALFVWGAMSDLGRSASQEAALAAFGIAFAVIPFCITRSIQLLLSDDGESNLRSVISEIRRETLTTQPLRPTTPQRTMVDPNIGDTKPEVTVHPEERRGRQENGEDKDTFGRTKTCPSCKEINFRDALVCFSCGKVLPKPAGTEPASWLG